MWKQSRSILGRTGISILLCALVLLVSSFGAVCHGAEKTVEVPMSQWNLLKQKVAEQQTVLTELEEKLKTLRAPSGGLRTQLSLAKEQLKKSRAELANAKISLQEAGSSILKLQKSLETLKKQIDKERMVQKRVLWQNRLWSFIGGIGIGIVVR